MCVKLSFKEFKKVKFIPVNFMKFKSHHKTNLDFISTDPYFQNLKK